jgi:hypothetical protein
MALLDLVALLDLDHNGRCDQDGSQARGFSCPARRPGRRN